MNLSEVFIKRPIATSLLMLAIALFGVVSYQGLAVSDLPNVDFPTLTVSARLPGASPSTMASSVATPLERQVTGISGLDSMTSSSVMGSTQITLQFDLNRNLDGAAVDLETAISAAMPLLPSGMPSPPSFRKSNPADFPIMHLGVTSGTLPLWVLDEYAQTLIAQRISMVTGVAQVYVMGESKYAVRVQADPRKLAARQIGINEVADAIQNWNVNLPTGTLYGLHKAYNLQADGQLMNAEAYRAVIVAWRHGSPVRLQDLGTVIDSVEDDKTASGQYSPSGGMRGINMMVMRQPNSNTIEVSDSIRRLVPTFVAQLPPSVQLNVRGDRSKNVRNAFHDMKFTLGLTLVLVIGVIFMFLRNFRATLIPSLALPFSIIGTFGVMYLLGYSLNSLSMMAIILSVGFVVDDAIVMLENIVRHLERGEPPMQAALNGSKEIGFTIISMTVSLAAVFIPVLFMGGILGRLFKEFAVSICAAVLISGFVSLSLTPMLCSRLLRPVAQETKGRFYQVTERFFDAVLKVYGASLRWVLRHRLAMSLAYAVILGATVYLYIKVPKGFIPEQDNDQIYVTTEAAQGTSFQRMAVLQQRVADIIRADPNVETFMSSAGGSSFGSVGGSSAGRMYVELKPRLQRTLSAMEIVNRLRPKVSGFPGIRVFLSVPPALRIGGRPSKSTYELTLQGPDTADLYKQSQVLERKLSGLPALLDVATDLQIRNPRVVVEIDRDKAAALQINAQQIQSSLYNAYGPSWVSTIYSPIAQYKVLLEVQPEYQLHADLLSTLYLKSGDGRLVPLDSVATLSRDAGPQSINHSGQLPSVTISFNLRPGVSLGEAMEEVADVAAKTLPANISTSFQGTAKTFQTSLQNLDFLLLIAVAVVYIVLGVLYESYIHPITILSGLPSAGFGALLTLLIFKIDLSIYAFVGFIMLIGIVKKNAIMQIDFALEVERREGKSPAEAIYEGCLERFRPIMMTTMAALLGALPMAVGYGAGSETRQPLGLAVV
ncbi:MAG: efflux RND transporter permease subunit, partial [Bryobacteraceae bacterium]